MARYNAKEAEQHWQAVWNNRNAFLTPEVSDKPKAYVLEMFPYPSGRIHMGHVRNYTWGDLTPPFRRAQGFNVLHPMAWTRSACRRRTRRAMAASIRATGPM